MHVTANQFLYLVTVGGMAKCAIPECPNPCFVDAQGKAFECCGYTRVSHVIIFLITRSCRKLSIIDEPTAKLATFLMLSSTDACRKCWSPGRRRVLQSVKAAFGPFYDTRSHTTSRKLADAHPQKSFSGRYCAKNHLRLLKKL